MNDEITLILEAINRGEAQSGEKLLSVVYTELRKIAASRMSHESAGHTLQPTALVHEAWLRLAEDTKQNWQSRNHFFVAAAEAMRRILIEHARRKSRIKRGGGQLRLNIDDLDLPEAAKQENLLLIDEALALMERENPERARIVTLKFFSGLTNAEVAETLGISESTVDRHWVCARRWLYNKIQSLN